MSAKNKNYRGERIPKCNLLWEEFSEILFKLKQAKILAFKDFYNEKAKRVELCPIEKNFKSSDKVIKNNEIKGIYIFYEKYRKEGGIYIGISQTILRRLRQHFLSKTHNHASLAFVIAQKRYEEENGLPYSGPRKDFPFEKYRPKIQEEMKNEWKIKVIPIEGISDHYRMALFEILLACELKTKWNTFETH